MKKGKDKANSGNIGIPTPDDCKPSRADPHDEKLSEKKVGKDKAINSGIPTPDDCRPSRADHDEKLGEKKVAAKAPSAASASSSSTKSVENSRAYQRSRLTQEREAKKLAGSNSTRPDNKTRKKLALAPGVEPGRELRPYSQNSRQEDTITPGAVLISGSNETFGDIDAGLDNPDGAGTMVEAELAVDRDGEIQAVREQNEELRRQVEAMAGNNDAQDIEQQQQQQGNTAIVVAVADPVEDSNKGDETNNQIYKRRVLMGVAFLLVVTAIALAAYFLTSKDDTEGGINTTGSPTNSPSDKVITQSPTTELLLYPKPTEDDCNAIANEEAVTKQDEMTVRVASLISELTLDGDTSLNSSLVDLLEGKVHATLIEDLIGCSVDSTDSANRELQDPVLSKRYAIANVETSIRTFEGESCAGIATGHACYPVQIDIVSYLKGDESPLALQSLYSEFLQGDAFVETVDEMGPPFITITVNEVEISDPTESPSSAPSTSPSVSPSNAPSFMPSTGPTGGTCEYCCCWSFGWSSVCNSALCVQDECMAVYGCFQPTEAPTPAPTPAPTCEKCSGDNNAGNACAYFNEENVECGSCIGWWACTGDNVSTVGTNSCNGYEACFFANSNIIIGRNSCNCNGCCSCLPENSVVPDNSCNTSGECC